MSNYLSRTGNHPLVPALIYCPLSLRYLAQEFPLSRLIKFCLIELLIGQNMTTQGHLGLLDEHCSIFSDYYFFLYFIYH